MRKLGRRHGSPREITLQAFGEIFSVIAPVFLIAAIGYGWRRRGRPFDGIFVSELVTNVGAPALIFTTIVGLEFDPQALAEMAVAALACFAAFFVIGAAVLRAAALPLSVYLPSMVFSNVGNMGLPLCLFAFGEEGLAYGVVIFAVYSVVHFVLGPAIAMGKLSPKVLLRLPVLHAVLISLVVVWAGWEVPDWIVNTTRLLGNATIPLMLLALGASLSQLHVTAVPRAAALGWLRLGMGFGVGLAVGWLLDLNPVARGVLLIDAAMPSAVFNYLFAQQFGSRAGEVASVVLLSTAFSFLTLPLLLGVAMRLG